MNILYCIEVPNGKHESVNMEIRGKLPFLPTVGMQIIAAKDDDYREIEEIHINTFPLEIRCYLKFADGDSEKDMRRFGWKLEGEK